MLSPGSSSFPRPIYQVPLLPNVPLVRPPPPQLHPSVVQRMIAQGVQPQQLGPALLQTGLEIKVQLFNLRKFKCSLNMHSVPIGPVMVRRCRIDTYSGSLLTGLFPQAVDLSQLQGLPPALLGQPLYPLGTAGHPLISQRAAGTHMPLAVMHQQRPSKYLKACQMCNMGTGFSQMFPVDLMNISVLWILHPYTFSFKTIHHKMKLVVFLFRSSHTTFRPATAKPWYASDKQPSA